MRPNDPIAVEIAKIQDHVGETQVGEHAPFTDQLLQMRAVVFGKFSVLAKKFGKRCHTYESARKRTRAQSYPTIEN